MVTMVWVVSRLRLKGSSWYLIFIYITTHIIGATYQRLMGPPTSEVGYTITTTRRENREVHKNRRGYWGRGSQLSTVSCSVDQTEAVVDRAYNMHNTDGKCFLRLR